MHMKLTELEAELRRAPAVVRRRFESKIDRNGPRPPHMPNLGPCWLWTGDRTDSGYGRINFRRQRLRAHRAALIFAGIDIGDGVVCHRCDNPPCVRPEHLFVGTMQDNARDAVEKGRMHPGSAPLEPRIMTQIRARAALGVPMRTLAKQYAISRRTVSRIVVGSRSSERLAEMP